MGTYVLVNHFNHRLSNVVAVVVPVVAVVVVVVALRKMISQLGIHLVRVVQPAHTTPPSVNR